VVTVPVQQVHEGTGKQQEVGENPEQVGPMLSQQEEGGNR
jgi:hypothetical protein